MEKKTTTGFVLGGLFALFLGLPTGTLAQGLTVSGYADFEVVVNNVNADDTDFYFDNHHFNLIMVGALVDDLFAAFEIEYEHAGEEVKMEYGYFGYTGFKDVRILAGKFIIPFGRFNKDIHPTTVNKIPGRPHGFRDIMPQTYNDVGIWLNGGSSLNDDSRFVWDAYVVNGLTGDEGGGIRSMTGNDREKAAFGRDDNKAVGARIGVELPYAGFDIGTSIYTGKYAESATAESLSLTLYGVDASYQKNGFTLRGELVSASQQITGRDLKKTGGYLQASYLVSPKFEPVVRWSARNMPGGNSSDLSRIAFGASVYVTPASSIRAAYIINSEKADPESDNNGLIFQFNVIL
jgi:hypothetical protein